MKRTVQRMGKAAWLLCRYDWASMARASLVFVLAFVVASIVAADSTFVWAIAFIGLSLAYELFESWDWRVETDSIFEMPVAERPWNRGGDEGDS